MVATGVSAALAGPPRELSWVVALLVVASLASISKPQAVGPFQLSVAGMIHIASIPLVGPVGAIVVAVLPVLLDRNNTVKRVFNASQRVLLVIAGSAAYAAAGGWQLGMTDTMPTPQNLALRVAVTAVAASLINAFLLAGVLQLSTNAPWRVVLVDVLKQTSSAYALSIVGAYLLVVLWAPAGLGWVAALFFLPSLLVIQWGLRQHAEEWATRHDVLAPFVGALELRHPGAAEDARVVAAAAGAIATTMGLSARVVDQVTAAARLRDVGKLALEDAPPAIRRRDHADASRRVFGSIAFLDESMEIITAHQERYDGEGRPHGLIGRSIPVGARVLATADAWGTCVLEGVSPEEAVTSCERMAGHALDPKCVMALRRALERDQLPKAVV
ncbi:HD-GYP domain-containing protein [Janibacter terrae]|uniref:HD-GYP domain-containing protein n=1 Tax=Janibacter terrae TaxID=103817 RepID=UPI00082D4DA9|nr:HD domain-containing phosphohydrolase [Janibacter terrae]